MREAGSLILCVDDNDGARYALVRTLQRAGFRTLEAATGTEALRKMADRPDLVVLDVQLPDINGYEVCQRIKSDPKTASNADIQAVATEVRAANAKVQAAAKNVSQTQATTVALAASRLVAAVKAVPPGTSPQQTLEQVEPVLKSTKTQFQASYNGLACSSTG